jgi:hypothetical protein
VESAVSAANDDLSASVSTTEQAGGYIRNIQQSVQDRDVIKQAPDIVVYINGRNYLTNPYVGGESGQIVSFNDYVTSFQAQYDTDSLLPTGSLALVVPNFLDYQFRMPGGNNLIEAMSEIRVFSKGSFLSPRGNTVYRQVFRGFIGSISASSDPKFTTFSLSLQGALGLLERTQIPLNPALMSASPMETVPGQSTVWNLGPYDQLASFFLYKSMIDGFNMYSLDQAALDKSSPYFDAINKGFVAKWQALLFDLARDVHIFGRPNVENVIKDQRDKLKQPETAATPMSKNAMATAHDMTATVSASDYEEQNVEFYDQLRFYMPDMSFGSIQLINDQPVSRLERIRMVTSLIGFEAYQDIDGAIIIKPPLYNLDVTDLSSPDNPAAHSFDYITEANNPFIVNLSEMEPGSMENEDEAGIRATRVLVRGSYDPGFQFSGTESFLATAWDVDLPRLQQFGLRTEPPIDARWIRNSKPEELFAYASAQLARANRSFRTYSFTIPLRPELKLGFPMYIPHRDIYGYIKSVSINYTQGGDAMMSILLDSVRRRPMIPETQTVTENGVPVTRTFMTPQSNLINQWTAAPKAGSNGDTTDKEGELMSLPVPEGTIRSQQRQMQSYRENKMKASYGPESDTETHCWRVQPDTAGIFTERRRIDSQYYQDLRRARPFTDGKGYELIGTWPWGRFDSLKNALHQFTVSMTLDTSASTGTSSAYFDPATIKPVSADVQTLSKAAAFLFTGTTDSGNISSVESLSASLASQAQLVSNFKVFELDYSDTTSDPLDNPEFVTAAIDTEVQVQDRTSVFLSGKTVTSDQTTKILSNVTATGQTATQNSDFVSVLQEVVPSI